MGYVIPPGFGQVVWRMFSGNGDGEINIQMGFEVEGTFSQANVDHLSQEFSTSVRPRINTGIRFIGAKVTIGNDGDPLIWESDNGGNLDGTRATNPWPLNCCYLVRKSSGLGGRKNRGRMYLPGGLASDIEAAGNLTTAGLTNANGYVTDLLGSDMTTGGGVAGWVILHSEGITGPPTPITGFAVEPKIATQRGRLR